MSRSPLIGKEVYELVLERRLLLTLLLISAVVSLVLGSMVNQSDLSFGHPSSPLEFLMLVQFAGPVMVGLLAVALAGDAVARERQDRTLHLLFTAPATRTGYWAAMVTAHLVAFAVFALLLFLFSLLAGFALGWVAVKGMAILLIVALLPLFLTLDLLVMASSARFATGRASLLVALVLVLTLWSTSLHGPFGWALEGVAGWSLVSVWHPFDLAGASAASLLDEGILTWTPMLTALAEVVAAALLAWTSVATLEVGR